MSAKPPTNPTKAPTKLPKLRLLDFVKRYPAASAAVGGALVLLAGWQTYQGMANRSAPTPPPIATAPSGRTFPAPGTPGAPTTPGAPGATATAPGPGGPGVTPGAPVTPGGPGSITGPSGRTDPFIPLVGPGGGPNPVFTDVPAVGPGMPLPPGVPPAGLAGEAGLRVAGIIWDRGVLAILMDERGSYIVGPGDEITPGLKVLRIDAARRLVQVQRSGGVEELTLQGRGGAGR